MANRGLGRGLGALIPGAVEEPTSDIALADIEANPHQPRRYFDQQALEELAHSISEHGLLQPVVVRPHQGHFQLVAGERRLRASKIAGLGSIPAVVMELSDRQVSEIALVENLQREDLNPMEEAEAYRKLIEDFSLTQDALAHRIGKSRPAIANTLRLLKLTSQVREMVSQGKLSPGHARTLLSLDGEAQVRAAEKMVLSGMTVRAAEKTKKARSKPKPATSDPNIIEVQQQLMEHLGTRVAVEDNKGRGRVVIEYYSAEDANRIIKKILE